MILASSWPQYPWLLCPCFEHQRRPIHGGIFNPNTDHPDLPPLRAERIPKRPMRGSPRVQLPIRLVARIDVDESSRRFISSSFCLRHMGE